MDEKRFRPRKRTTNRPENSDDFYNRDSSYEQRPYNQDYGQRGERQPRNYTAAGSYGQNNYQQPHNRHHGGGGGRQWQGDRPQGGRSYDNRGGYEGRGGYDNRGGGGYEGRGGYDNRRGGGGYQDRQPRHEGRGYQDRQPRPEGDRGGYGYGGGGYGNQRPQHSGYGRPQAPYQNRQGGGRPNQQQRYAPPGKQRPGLGGRKQATKRHSVTLAKALVRMHYASRQLALQYIQKGMVELNGYVQTQPNLSVSIDRDQINVGSRPLRPVQTESVFFAVHKPRQMALMSHKNGAAYKFLTKENKWYFPSGRLDKASSGIIIITNDPKFRNSEESPLLTAPKEYRIKVNRAPLKKELTAIEKALNAAAGEGAEKTKVALHRKNARNSWISVHVFDISPNVIRKILKDNKLEVLSFERYSIGGVNIDEIPPGAWRRMNQKELFSGETGRKAETKEKISEEQGAVEDDKKTLWQQLYKQWFKST